MARESKRTRDAKRFGRPERLADLVVHGANWIAPAWIDERHEAMRAEFQALRDDVLAEMPRAKVVEASNVTEFFYAITSKEDWLFRDDFHCVALPFPSVFVETKRPSTINSEGEFKSSSGLPEQWGWLLTSQDVRNRTSEFNSNRDAFLRSLQGTIDSLWKICDTDVVREALRRAKAEGPSALDDIPVVERTTAAKVMQYMVLKTTKGDVPPPNDGTRWYVEGTLFARFGDRIVVPGGCSYRVSDDGRLVDLAPVWKILGGEVIERSEIVEAIEIVSQLSQATFMTLSFMGCKNVSTESHEPDRKLNRERTRHGLKPFMKYHTINIDPVRKALKAEGGVEANGLKKALHIVRGHFSRYTAERPLFGKYAGTFWMPSHVRGSLDEGVVVSDYKVGSPEPVGREGGEGGAR